MLLIKKSARTGVFFKFFRARAQICYKKLTFRVKNKQIAVFFRVTFYLKINRLRKLPPIRVKFSQKCR